MLREFILWDQRLLKDYFVKNPKGVKGKKKVMVSRSLIAVGAVGVRVPLYLRHS